MFAWLVPMIVGLGLVTSYEDVSFGKIRNRWISVGVAYGAAVYVFHLVVQGDDGVGASFLNGFLATVVTFGLWYLRFWSAGDAKLVAVYSFLVPAGYYSHSPMPGYPALAVLINTFVPALAVMLAMMVPRFPHLLPALVSRVRVLASRKREAVGLLLGLFVTALVGDLMRTHLGPFLPPAVLMVLVMIVYRPLSPYLAKKNVVLGLMMVTAALVAALLLRAPDSAPVAMLRLLMSSVLYLLGFGLLMAGLQTYFDNVGVRRVKVGELSPRMVLTDKAVLALEEEGIGGRRFPPDGLDADAITKIRSIRAHETELEVHRTIPFAPIALTGVVLTLIFRASIVHVLWTTLKGG